MFAHPFRVLLEIDSDAAAEKVRVLLKKHSCNIRAVAREIGVSETTFYKWVAQHRCLKLAIHAARRQYAATAR